MATIDSLKPSITQLPHEEAFELIKNLRTSRRTSKKSLTKSVKTKGSKKRSSKLSPLQLFSMLDDSMKQQLLQELTGKL